MRFILTEEILNEDIASMMKMYPNISEEDFMKYISLDPTYQRGSNNAGTYARWILDLVKRGKFENEGHIRDILTRFNDNKKNLINKDIMKYKSVDELEAMLNDDSSYKEKSHRQEVRDRQNARKNADIEKDADLVYEDDKWEVYVPKTYAASCKLGSGAKWCTASTESDYYYKYYQDTFGGEYYININKNNPAEKYQFHFESNQYMDAEDNPIDLEDFLNENAGLKEFYGEKIRKGAEQILKNSGIKLYDTTFTHQIDPATLVDALVGTSRVSRNFIYDALAYEGDDMFYSGYFNSTQAFDALSEETINILNNRLEENGTDVIIEDDHTFDEALELDDDVNEIIKRAYYQTEGDASRQMFINDVIECIEDSVPFECELYEEYGKIYITAMNDEAVESIAENITRYNDVAGGFDIDSIMNLDDFIGCAIIRDGYFTEPRYGWWDFDDDEFNELISYGIDNLDALNS